MKTIIKSLILVTAGLLATSSALAYELNGTLTDTGSDNTYVVSVENDEGHVYNGLAVRQHDGSLKVEVSDGVGEAFKGVAVDNGYDEYELHLKNETSGSLASGTVDGDEY